ncbi:MAG: hypothetical protein IIZ66_09575 [Clostridia bacterium]|nr:hypothetical protein [Clostridia bacterium]
MLKFLIFIIILAIILAIAVPLGIKQGKENKKLFEEGKIIQRPLHFAEKGEEFVSRIGTTDNLKAELEKMVLPCETKGNTTQATFTGSSYSARLYRVDFDEPSGVAIYRFEFTAWKTNSATYVEAISMNRLMTAVEKAFLALDPNTAVTSYDIDFKTKHSII